MAYRKWINTHPKTVVLVASVGLLMLIVTTIVTYLPQIREELEYRRQRRQRALRMTTRRKYTPPVVRARLAFEKIPLQVKELSGEVRPLKKRGKTVKCGDSLDVMWYPTEVLFMKEKGLFEQVLAAGDARFSDLECDGRNVWVSIPKKGIWILDTSGQIVARVGPENDLPPAERGLLLHPIEPGRMFAVGSFGPFGRGWCAVVEFKNGEPSLNVFHEAKNVLPFTHVKNEISRDPFVVFRPYWIRDCLAFPQPFDPNIVILRPYGDPEYRPGGRRTLFVARCEKKYQRRHRLRYPLEIDLETLSVRISSRPITSLRIRSILPGPKLEYNGKLYLPGKAWYCIDPSTRRQERLVTQGQLPDPYGSLRAYWVSAHYGLAGWTANGELYQIRVTDEEHDMTPASPPGEDKYYHILVFEDANGSKPHGVKYVRLAIHRKDQRTLKYGVGLSGRAGYYPPGRYEAWGTRINSKGKEVKVCDFEPIEVTEDSPVRLVLRTKPAKIQDAVETGPVTAAVAAEVPVQKTHIGGSSQDANTVKQEAVRKDDSILYSGQVVNAVTRKPVEGASVRIKRQIVKTDSNGRFEIRYRPKLTHDALKAFKEGYFGTEIVIGDLPRPKTGRVEIQPMLFPAAKLRIVPIIGGDAPAGYRRIAGWARIRPWVIVDANENPIWSSTFSSMYGWRTERGCILVPRLEMNQEHTFPVPAGVNFRLLLITKYESLCPPDISKTINLKQGEVLDLGPCVFKPAVRIFLKVVNSAGEPVKGIAITKTFSETYYFTQSILQGRPQVHITDENGRTAFDVRLNSEEKFDVYRDVRNWDIKNWDVLKSVTFKIGGKEDEGKEFTIEL